ncbi:hypothetical protein C7N43_18450 [Sphingobacteriales bacterium UPWRP_1]|nr:hypothetical protein BVG80_03230 [Sphingobacteriales bacterium TSM_CSM]PSJ75549.1 hypothetical protein C7N43_18450 [Sphingobacteriales bacterium UPWRP_1]
MQPAKTAVWCLRLLCFCVSAGRAWQHLRWDAPYRALLWSETFLLPLFERMGWQWQYWVSHSDVYIGKGIKAIGVFFAVCAVASVTVSSNHRAGRYLLPAGGVMLLFLSALYWKEKYFFVGELIEYSSQVACPFLLYAMLYRRPAPKQIMQAGLVAVALTFIGHGLFAIGYYPVPGSFQQMMVNFFGMPETVARRWLLYAGVMDMVVAAGIFVGRLRAPLLAYAAIWGFVTAFARLIANYDAHIPLYSFNLWLFEVLVRIPNGGLPVFLLLLGNLKKTVGEAS